MDPQNAQFHALVVAPELIRWKVSELESLEAMTDDEVIRCYSEIEHLASLAKQSASQVKEARRNGLSQVRRQALPSPSQSVEEQKPEPKPKPKPKRKAKPKRKTQSGKARSIFDSEGGEERWLEMNDIDGLKTPGGRAVRRMRVALRMTQKEFADTVGIHPVTFSQMERGKVKLSETYANRIAKAFNFNPEILLNPQDNEDQVDVIVTSIERDREINE